MAAIRRLLSVSAGVAMTAGIMTLPASTGFAAERTPMLSYDFSGFSAAASGDVGQPAPQSQDPATIATADDESVTCLAKVVHHEARNQPRSGQVAVAQTLVNRLKAGGRFGNSICEVANQRGQYFNTSAYRPHDDETWSQAVDVARDTLSGNEEQVVPGALFFRAAYGTKTGFFRTRQRIASVGDHVFYR